MTQVLRLFVLAAMLALLSGCATTPPSQVVNSESELEGLWQGSIDVASTPGNPLTLRLLLDQGTARVWLSIDGNWIEAKPGAFRVGQELGNAIVQATDSGLDGDGRWVETWTIVVTPASDDSVLVAWSRVVNNVDLPAGQEGAVFAEQGSGVLRHVVAN